jgi:hypothetical protein
LAARFTSRCAPPVGVVRYQAYDNAGGPYCGMMFYGGLNRTLTCKAGGTCLDQTNHICK